MAFRLSIFSPSTVVLVFLLCLVPDTFSQRNKVYVISDTHIGVEALFTHDACVELWGFFDRLADAATDAKRLVIAGDVVDHWLIPADEYADPYSTMLMEPRCFDKSLADKLNEVASNGVRIDVLVGNHDLEMTQDDFFVANVSNATLHNIGALTKLESSPVYGANWEVRHGHEFDLFNAPDYVYGLRPVGYYMSRCQASKTDPRYWSPNIFNENQWNAAWNINAQRNLVVFAELFLELMLKGLTLGDCWDMEIVDEGCWYRNSCEEKNVTFGDAAAKHASVYERFYVGLGLDMDSAEPGKSFEEWLRTFGSVLDGANEVDYYMRVAMNPQNEGPFDYFLQKYFLPQRNRDLMVFGHTHTPQLVPVSETGSNNGQNEDILVYANTGTWTVDEDNQTRSTFVRITLDSTPEETAIHVEMCAYNSNLGEDVCTLMLPGEGQMEETDLPSTVTSRRRLERRGVSSVPGTWTCPSEMYDSGYCSCECGAWDPACNATRTPTNCMLLDPSFDHTCNSATLKCEYVTPPVPVGWTCDPGMFFGDFCYVNCGAYDPICSLLSPRQIIGCAGQEGKVPLAVVNERGSPVCIYGNLTAGDIPKLDTTKWRCPRIWYPLKVEGSRVLGDGCDCDCGSLRDPQCGDSNYADDGLCRPDCRMNKEMYDVVSTLVGASGIWSVVAVVAWFVGIGVFTICMLACLVCVCCWDRIVTRKEEKKKGKNGENEGRKYAVLGRCGHFIPQECHSVCVSCLLSSGEGSQDHSMTVRHSTCHWLFCSVVHTKKQTVCDLLCSVVSCGWCFGNFLVWVVLFATIIYLFGLVVPWETLQAESPDVAFPIVILVLIVLIAFLVCLGAIFSLFFLRGVFIWCVDNGKCMKGVEEGDGHDRYSAADCCGEKCRDNKCCDWIVEWIPVLAAIKTFIFLQNTVVLILGILMILMSFVGRMDTWMMYWGIFLVVLAVVIYLITLIWICLRRFCDNCLNKIEDILETGSNKYEVSVSPIAEGDGDVEMKDRDDEEESEGFDIEEGGAGSFEYDEEEAGSYEYDEEEAGGFEDEEECEVEPIEEVESIEEDG